MPIPRHIENAVIAIVRDNAPGLADSADVVDGYFELTVLGGGEWLAETAHCRPKFVNFTPMLQRRHPGPKCFGVRPKTK
jgi:hypothetical protein